MKTEKAEARLQKIRSQETPYTTDLCGTSIEVQANVYPTSELSELVVECFDRPDCGIKVGDRVLDYGTGTGFLGIQAALRGASVLAVDINPDAVRCAYSNAQRAGIADNMEIRQGRNFEAIRSDEKFDWIVAGMPWDDADAPDLLERSVYDPGFEMRRALFDIGRLHLTDRGRIFVTYAEGVQRRYPLQDFDSSYHYAIVNRRIIKGEEHFVYMITAEKSEGAI